ncbi:hypothetical protein SLE2022_103020 [Rubroshorea leprosula]
MTPSAVCSYYHPQVSNIVCQSSFSIVTSAHRTEQKAQKIKPKTNSGSSSSSSTRSIKGFGRGRKELWGCVEGCGACCKLAKGPSFATPEEIFTDPADIELYRSLIGADGWCIHFEKSTRTCSIYSDRPYFCRVEPEVFKSLYGIDKKKFNKEACSCCRDTIKAIYGSNSEELKNFNRSVWSSDYT